MGRLHPHAGRSRVPHRQQALRLDVPVRAGAVHARPADLPRAREGARRVKLDQRDDLPARQPARLRALGGRAGPRGLVVSPLPPLFQADGDLPRRRGRFPRRRRPARPRARPRDEPALRRVLRRGETGRVRVDGGRQRSQAGRLREVRSQHPSRPSAERSAGVPPPGHAAPQSRGADEVVRRPGALRRHARGRRASRRGDHPRKRGHPLRRGDQFPAAPAALGHRSRSRSWRRSASAS